MSLQDPLYVGIMTIFLSAIMDCHLFLFCFFEHFLYSCFQLFVFASEVRCRIVVDLDVRVDVVVLTVVAFFQTP